MMKLRLIVLLIVLSSTTALAQQWVNPHFDTHRMDYRELGYPRQNLIPADNAQITALMDHSNGFVYGATSGKTQSYMFFYNRYINKVRPLGKIANANGVYHCMIEGADGVIFIGTGLNMLAPLELTKDFPVGIEAIEKQLWKDIKGQYDGYGGGHVYRYDPREGDVVGYTNDDACPLKDLGIPVAGNGLYAMTLNLDKSKIYGMSYPDAHFFEFDIKSGETRDFGDIMTHKVFSGPERNWRTVPRALHVDESTGHVYTSGDNGFILRYIPGNDKLELTYMRLPGEYWEGLKSWDYPVVEAFDSDSRGRIFCATSDGYLVRLDIPQDYVVVLGKPRIARRTRAMSIDKSRDIAYMITGEPERAAKLHTYDLSGERGFQELGPFAVDRSPYYNWRAYQFDAMAIGPDGTVFCGESDRNGKLFYYIPGPGVFKGGLNPTNPVVERQRKDTPALIQERL